MIIQLDSIQFIFRIQIDSLRINYVNNRNRKNMRIMGQPFLLQDFVVSRKCITTQMLFLDLQLVDLVRVSLDIQLHTNYHDLLENIEPDLGL